MAMLYEYGVTGDRLKMDDSVISSQCSRIETEDDSMHELFRFHLNYDGTSDLGSPEFYANISSTSTPSAVRSFEVHQRNDYDTDDSGFCENLVSDTDLLQMSNLRLGDDLHWESSHNAIADSRRSDILPFPKLCLLSHFDEYSDKDLVNTPRSSHGHYESTSEKTEALDMLPSERVSVRRQRSPEAAVERCSRHRLSLDSFSESRSDDCLPVRRSSDSFVPVYDPDEVLADLPAPTLDDPSQCDLPPTAVDSAPQAQPSPAPDDPLMHHMTPVLIGQPYKKPSQEEIAFGLQCILAMFAPACLSNLIGRKMGLEYVDIISELWDRSMSLIVRQICDYLTDTDICR